MTVCECSTPAPRPEARQRISRSSPSLELVALDDDEARLERVAGNLSRLRLTAKLHAADAADTGAWWDGIALRSHPARCSVHRIGRRTPPSRMASGCGAKADIDGFVAQQKRLLDALWPCLEVRRQAALCNVFDFWR